MTIAEAIQAITGSISTNLIEKVCTDLSVSSSATYSTSYTEVVEKAVAYIYRKFATDPDIKEGDLSIVRSKGWYLSEANRIFRKYEMTSELSGSQPTVNVNTAW